MIPNTNNSINNINNNNNSINNNNISNTINNTSKDILINQLKNRIFDLEQQNQNYSKLQSENTKLVEIIDDLKSNQLRNDYESTQKISLQQNTLNDYKNENENLTSILNEKININKK